MLARGWCPTVDGMTMRGATIIAAGVLAAACGNGKGAGTTPRGPVTLPEPTDDVFEISQRGVGPIIAFTGTFADDDGNIAALKELLGGPESGLDVAFGVIDIGDEVEAEEGYYSIRVRDEEIARVMRTEPVTVYAVSPRYRTRDNIRVGMKLADLAAARPSVTCTATERGQYGSLTCRTAEEPDVIFVFIAACFPGEYPAKETPVEAAKLGACEILEIVR